MLDLQSIYFGQMHKDFAYKDYDLIRKIARLARKHQRQSENDCNGVGYVNGQVYYCGQIDLYAKEEYGYNVKSAYASNEETSIFNLEAEKIEEKIKSLLLEKNQCEISAHSLWRVEFQGDPRGATVKLFYENEYIGL